MDVAIVESVDDSGWPQSALAGCYATEFEEDGWVRGDKRHPAQFADKRVWLESSGRVFRRGIVFIRLSSPLCDKPAMYPRHSPSSFSFTS